MEKKVFTKKEQAYISRAYAMIDYVMESIEARNGDTPLEHGNGSVLEQLGCSLAALECIYQEYEF